MKSMPQECAKWLACSTANEDGGGMAAASAVVCGCCGAVDSMSGGPAEGPPCFSLRSAAARLSKYCAANWCFGSMRMCSMWCRSPVSWVKTLWQTVQGHMRSGEPREAASG